MERQEGREDEAVLGQKGSEQGEGGEGSRRGANEEAAQRSVDGGGEAHGQGHGDQRENFLASKMYMGRF